ncbi:MAG: gamma-glutamyltransferase family protein [Thermoanaerobacteraceae bacterium]|nr:gamma-glutamyltransferase family protein [Thermoanaerobacteraceae bacterium]
MDFDSLKYNYPSRRNVVYGRKGMVATSQPLAAQAGLDTLKRGGNAVDAAIATAACLTVVEPTSNGIGADNFAILWIKDKLYGLNSSGYAPRNISIQELKNKGYTEIPRYGFIPVTVPGAPSGWAELSRRFGKMPLTEVLKPAIDYAINGYPVSASTALMWQRALNLYTDVLKGEEFKCWFETFAPDGRAPQPGEIVKLRDHGETLKEIAETNAESFYRGNLAEKIGAFSKRYGGYLDENDLATFKSEWVDPIKVNYRGYDIWELPPNGQGIVALMALNILKGFDFIERENVNTYHLMIEAIKLAFADAHKYVADPHAMKVTVDELLSDAYADERRKLIGKTAIMPTVGNPKGSGTVYLCTADSEGNMVSMIQSNYMGFGSGLVVPGTGIALQNRGHNFSFDESHDNCLAPNKKPYHTIIPGFMTKDGKAIGPFGVMGGFMQPQGHVQVIMNTIDFHMNPQEALDAPRIQWTGGKGVQIEPHAALTIAQGLSRLGHEVVLMHDLSGFGRGQIIWRDDNGSLCGGTEPRTDGYVAAW